MSKTRSEIEKELHGLFPALNEAQVKAAVEIILSGIADSVQDGRRVAIKGFGAFSQRSRRIVNKQQPDMVMTYPYFKASKKLNVLNGA